MLNRTFVKVYLSDCKISFELMLLALSMDALASESSDRPPAKNVFRLSERILSDLKISITSSFRTSLIFPTTFATSSRPTLIDPTAIVLVGAPLICGLVLVKREVTSS